MQVSGNEGALCALDEKEALAAPLFFACCSFIVERLK